MWQGLVLLLLSVATAQEYTGWVALRNACLRAEVVEFMSAVATEAACLILCQEKTNFPCRAISYQASLQRCGFYSTTSQSVFIDEPCPTTGLDTLEVMPYYTWNNSPQGCLAVYPDGQIQSSSTFQCKEVCLGISNFQCNSFTVNNGSCFFSKDSSRTMAIINPCNETTTDYHYYERSRSPLFKFFNNTVISGSVSRTIEATSIPDCEIACEIETNFNCKSITYRQDLRQCQLRNHNSNTNTLSASATTHYEERINRARWRWEYDGCVDQNEVKQSIGNLTVDGCYAECETHYGANTDFNCTSVTYDAAMSLCYLSAENSYSSPSKLHIPCFSPLSYYAEIMCTDGADHPA